MRGIITHSERFPLVIIEFGATYSHDDLMVGCAENAALLARGEHFVTVRDLRELQMVPSSAQRRYFAAWEREHGEAIAENCLGVANVSESRILRGVMTAIQWITPAPTPEVMVPSMERAVDWGAALFRARGLAIPDAFRRTA